MRAHRFSAFGEREVCLEAPEPGLGLSPLAQAQGVSDSFSLPECGSCVERATCLASVIELGPFACAVCEMALRQKAPYRHGRANPLTVATLKLVAAQPGLRAGEIARLLGVTEEQIWPQLAKLQRWGAVRVDRAGYRGFRYFVAAGESSLIR